MSMKWKIIPDGEFHVYSDEIKQLAHIEALKAALATHIELVDCDESVINSLGEKWSHYFSSAYFSLKHRFGDDLDDLIVLVDRLHKYTTVYDSSLKINASVASDLSRLGVCGALLAQHYSAACRPELLANLSIGNFPGTGDVLEVLSVNRIMQAAISIGDNTAKALDLLADAMAAKFLYTQGEMRLESFYALKNDRKMFAKKSVAAKLANDPKQAEKKFIEECWVIWQSKPGQYKNKASFARAMLQKCEHLKSQKKIEDWCREWGKAKS